MEVQVQHSKIVELWWKYKIVVMMEVELVLWWKYKYKIVVRVMIVQDSKIVKLSTRQ